MFRYSPIPWLLATALLLAGCASTPPRAQHDLCEVFGEKSDWYEDARRASQRWGVPIHLQMAILRHESSYRENARPPRDYLLGFIPWFRSSSAYGFAQAQDSTWSWYIRETGNRWAARNDFADAMDFVGWYLNKSSDMLGISKTDAYSQYLAYHEGQGGYRRGSYRDKPWLMDYARKVAQTSASYARQLSACGPLLEASGGSWWWPF